MQEEVKDKLADICRRFCLPGELTAWRRLSGGNINLTYAVTLSAGQGPRTYLVQRVNGYVFRDPVGLMKNIDRVTRHLMDQEETGERLGTLRYYRTASGENYVMLDQGETAEIWRVCDFIVNTVTFEAGEGEAQVLRGAGKGFGGFLRRLRELDPSELAETIPHFHDTAYRLREFFRIVEEDPLGRAKDVEREITVIRGGRELAGRLSARREQGELPVRVTHNDTKTSNILFDRETLEPLAVIDLDTCMPGLVCYDFGDLVRFAACRAEKEGGFRLDPDRFRACSEGFLSETADFLTGAEIDALPVGAAAVTLELASRFLGDYLVGDLYFRTEYPTHNLDRARRQLELYQDMLLCMEEMKRIIDSVLA